MSKTDWEEVGKKARRRGRKRETCGLKENENRAAWLRGYDIQAASEEKEGISAELYKNQAADTDENGCHTAPNGDCVSEGPCIHTPPPPLTSENPKAEAGVLKTALSYVPLGPIMEMAIGMMEGGYKYGRHNYRHPDTKISASIYFDALVRHIFAWWEGEDIDPESGEHHITKAMTTLAVLRDAQITGKFRDDRPPKLPEDWLVKINERAKALNAKYPNKRAVTTEKTLT